MKLKMILQTLLYLAGPPLTISLLYIVSIHNSEKLDFKVVYFISSPCCFLLKSCSLFCLYKNSKTQSNCSKFFAQLTQFIGRVFFLSVIITLTLHINDWILAGLTSLIFINSLFWQDYLQQRLWNNIKIQLYTTQNTVVIYGPMCLESIGLLVVSIYVITHKGNWSSTKILFDIIIVLLIFYQIVLRILMVVTQSKAQKKKVQASTPQSKNNKYSFHNLTTESYALNINPITESDTKINHSKIETSIVQLKNEINNESVGMLQDQGIEKSSKEFLQIKVINKENKINESGGEIITKQDSIFEEKIDAPIMSASNLNKKYKTKEIKMNKIFSDEHLCKKKKMQKNSTYTNFICFDPYRSLLSNKSDNIEKSEPIKALWEFLPNIFVEGVSIFEGDRMIKHNSAFLKFIATIINQDIQAQDIYSSWQEIFDQIQVINRESQSSVSNNIELLNLREELLKIIGLPSNQTDMQIKYTVEENDKIFQLSVFKTIVSDAYFTIIKIDDFSNEYEKLSRKAIQKIKKKFRLSLAHEVKTPFNYLISTIKPIKNDIPSNSYNQLKSSAKTFQLNLNGVLKVAFVEDQKHIECFPENFSIFTTLQKIINNVRDLFQNRGLQLIFESDVTGSESTIYHDKIVIETIIYQFLSNSLKFTKTGKVIVKLLYNTGDDNFQITFFDTGIGMTDKEIQNLQKFLNSCINTNMEISQHSTGANIGLNICKSLLLRIHKNDDTTIRISFTSQHNISSTFIVKISKQCPSEKRSIRTLLDIKSLSKINFENNFQYPSIRLESQSEDQKLLSVGTEKKLPQFYSTIQTNLNSKFFGILNSKIFDNLNAECYITSCACPFRIFVVDDEEFNIVSFNRMCSIALKNSPEKYELITAHDGQEGLETFFDYFENKKCKNELCCPIKLAVIDHNMPKLIGPKVASEITKYLLNVSKQNEVRVYGWTAYLGVEYKNDFMKAGATGILSKPIKIKELSQIISEFVKP